MKILILLFLVSCSFSLSNSFIFDEINKLKAYDSKLWELTIVSKKMLSKNLNKETKTICYGYNVLTKLKLNHTCYKKMTLGIQLKDKLLPKFMPIHHPNVCKTTTQLSQMVDKYSLDVKNTIGKEICLFHNIFKGECAYNVKVTAKDAAEKINEFKQGITRWQKSGKLFKKGFESEELFTLEICKPESSINNFFDFFKE